MRDKESQKKNHFFLVGGSGEAHLVVLMPYSWLLTQGSFLVSSGDYLGNQGLNPGQSHARQNL